MKNITRDEYLSQQAEFFDKHVAYHPANAFCGTAGQAERQHIKELIAKLTDKELEELVSRCGINFHSEDIDRDAYEGVVDEIDREEFYKIYNELSDRADRK